ncbi:MAG: universal stress protein [Nitrosopumilus sp.]|nr:universal stress protein [Nitrosopumilus sp.]
MKKERKILVPLDGSTNSIRSLKYAITLAKQNKMGIIGLHIRPVYALSASSRNLDLKEELIREGKNIMKNARMIVEKNNIPFFEKTLNGIPPEDVANFIQKKDNELNLVIMGSSSKGISKERYLGSVSNHVLNKSKIPVLVI